MFFLFFTYCSHRSENFLQYTYSKDFYNTTLQKKFKNQTIKNPSIFLLLLANFATFYTRQFENFFIINILSKHSLKLFFNEMKNNELINLYFSQDIENSPDTQTIFQGIIDNNLKEIIDFILKKIMDLTFKEIHFAFTCLEDYEKKSIQDRKKNKNYTKEYFSAYSVPEIFKKKDEIFYETNKDFYLRMYKINDFYTKRNKLNFFWCMQSFIQIFINEQLSKPTLKQHHKIYKLIFNYFLSKLHVDINNPLLYLMNKEKSTLSTTSDIDLAEKNFQIFQKIYNEDNNLDKTSQLNYDSTRSCIITNLFEKNSTNEHFKDKNPTSKNVDFIKYLFQQYPKTIYDKFIDTLIHNKKEVNLLNLAIIIIINNFNSCAKGFDDLLKK